MINLKLGILYKDGQIVNHRSLLKVLFNPLLRCFGFQIGTQFYPEQNNKLGRPELMKCDVDRSFNWNVNNHNPYDKIEKKRRFI